MGKILSGIVTGIFLISAILGTISLLPDVQEYVEKIFGGQNFAIILLYFLIIVGFAILIIPILVANRVIDFIAQWITRRNVSITILEGSKRHLGGVLLFKIEYTALLNNGYFRIQLRSPFNEEDSLYPYYNKIIKKGILRGHFQKRSFQYKWDIPTNFTQGKFKINIELWNMISWFGIRKQYRLKMQEEFVDINESTPKQIISIHKVTNPKLKALDNIDLNSKPMSGWICIKIQNTNDFDIKDCFGKIVTDIGDYALYDYEAFIKNGEKSNIEDFVVFPIDNNSTKRLYAKIESNNTIVKSEIDFGKEEINQELSLITSF